MTDKPKLQEYDFQSLYTDAHIIPIGSHGFQVIDGVKHCVHITYNPDGTVAKAERWTEEW